MKRYLDLVPISAKVHKKQNRMSVFCIVLAVFLVTTIFGMADMFVRSQVIKTQVETGNWHIGIQNISEEDAAIIASRPEVVAFAPYNVLNYDGDQGYTLRETDTLICGSNDALFSKIFPNMVAGGAFPKSSTEAMVTENAKDMLGLNIGDEITVDGPEDAEYRFIVSGFVANVANLMSSDSYGVFLTTEGQHAILPAEAYSDPTESHTVYYVQFASTGNVQKEIENLKTQCGLSDDQVSENIKLLGLLGQSTNSFMIQVYAAAAVLFILVLFAGIMMIASSLNSNVAQRTEFFGLMRCIGATPKQVMRLVRKEALTWCRFAIPLGVAAGVIVIWILCFILRLLSPEFFGAMPVFSVSAPSIIAGVVVGLLTVLLAARTPAKKAAKVSPLAAVSGNANDLQPVKKAANTKLFNVDTALGIHHARSSRKNFILMVGSFGLSIVLFLAFAVTIDFMNHTLMQLHPYARDTSKKIRSVKKTTALNGGFCGSFAPYGYIVDPDNKRQLLVDPDTAPTVKRIFELSKQGNSVHQIARTLCEDGILIPRAYRAMKNGTLETSTGFKFPTDWVGKNVKMILENQVYLGHMVSHKTQTKSFKNRKLVSVPKEEWIIVRNTHEPIIDEETFELVQKFISVKKQPNKTGRPNMFVGLVKCPDCGRNMAFSNPNGKEPRFRCRTYARNSNLCTTHAISYDALQQIVMGDIQKHIRNMETLVDQFIKEMHELSEKGGDQRIKQFKHDLELVEKRIAEIDSVIMKLFEQNALGKISDERFEKLSSAYENEQKELTQKRNDLKDRIKAEEKKTQSTNQFLETIRKYETVTELNRSMLVELIDSIYVYQAEGVGKERKQKVEINYRFLAGSQCGIA